jgi:acyl-homoserine lactone synthase
MCCAVMEFCLSEGVHWVGGVQEAYWMPLATSLGWEIQALGLPEVVDGTSVLAAFTGVSEAALESAQTTTGITTPQIVHLGPRKPFLPTTVAAATNIERAEPKLISNGQNADLNQFRAELEALERLCRYVTLEAAGLELEEAERLASAAAATIRERIENLIAH